MHTEFQCHAMGVLQYQELDSSVASPKKIAIFEKILFSYFRERETDRQESGVRGGARGRERNSSRLQAENRA